MASDWRSLQFLPVGTLHIKILENTGRKKKGLFGLRGQNLLQMTQSWVHWVYLRSKENRLQGLFSLSFANGDLEHTRSQDRSHHWSLSAGAGPGRPALSKVILRASPGKAPPRCSYQGKEPRFSIRAECCALSVQSSNKQQRPHLLNWIP